MFIKAKFRYRRLLSLIDEKTDTFAEFTFKFYGQFKAEDPCYPLSSI